MVYLCMQTHRSTTMYILTRNILITMLLLTATSAIQANETSHYKAKKVDTTYTHSQHRQQVDQVHHRKYRYKNRSHYRHRNSYHHGYKYKNHHRYYRNKRYNRGYRYGYNRHGYRRGYNRRGYRHGYRHRSYRRGYGY